jgi:hypothetical protein
LERVSLFLIRQVWVSILLFIPCSWDEKLAPQLPVYWLRWDWLTFCPSWPWNFILPPDLCLLS